MKLLSFLCLLVTVQVFAQSGRYPTDPSGNVYLWNKATDDTLSFSIGTFGHQVADTTTLKLATADSLGETRYLKGLSSTNTLGGGWFSYQDSLHAINDPEYGSISFASPTAGKHWIRTAWLDKRGVRTFEWFGAIGDSATLDSAALQNCADVGTGKIVGRAGATYRLGKVGMWIVAHNVTIDLNGSTLYYNTQDTTGAHFTAGLFDLSAINFGGNTTITDQDLFWRNAIVENGSIISNGDSAGVVGDPAYYDTLNAAPVAYDRRRNVQVNSGAAIHAHSVRNLIVRNMYFRWVGRAIDVENRITGPTDLDVGQVHFENSFVQDWGSVAVIAPAFSNIIGVTFDNRDAPSLSQADISADKGSSHGIYFTGSKGGNSVIGCKFFGVRTHAIQWFSGGDGGFENIISASQFVECHKPLTFSGSDSKNFQRILFSESTVRDCGTIDMSGPNKFDLHMNDVHFSGRDPHGAGVDSLAPNEPHFSITAGSVTVNDSEFRNSGDDGSAASILINTDPDISYVGVFNSLFADSVNSTIGTMSFKIAKDTDVQTIIDLQGNTSFHNQFIVAGAADSVVENLTLSGNNIHAVASQISVQLPAGYKAVENKFHMKLNSNAFFIQSNSGGGKLTWLDGNHMYGDGANAYVVLNSLANGDANSIYYRGGVLTGTFSFNAGTTLLRKSYESDDEFVTDSLHVTDRFTLYNAEFDTAGIANNSRLNYNSATGNWEMGVDAGGAGSGTMNTVKEGGVQVGGNDIVTIDFGAGFDVAESPDTETNITLDLTEKQVNLTTEVTGSLPDANVDNNITIDLAATATALAANGANAGAGNAILGVDASGAAEGAFDVWTEAENTSAAYLPKSEYADSLRNRFIFGPEDANPAAGDTLLMRKAGVLTRIDIGDLPGGAAGDSSFVTLQADTLNEFNNSNIVVNADVKLDCTFVHQNKVDATTSFQVLDADGGTPVLNIDTVNERVGIGTAAPTKKLDLVGDVLVTSTSDSDGAIRFNVAESGFDVPVYFENATSGTGMAIGIIAAGASDYAEFILRQINSAGEGFNVGILGANADLAFTARSGSNNERMRVTNAGNVGIGTTTPDGLLNVESLTANAEIYNTADAASISALYLGDENDNNIGGLKYHHVGDSLEVLANNAVAMTVLSDGKVGLDTPSPVEKLHIDEAAGTDGTGRWFANASVSTTDGAATTIYTLATTTDRAYRLVANVVGAQDDGSNTMATSWSFVLKNVAGTVTEQQDAVIGTEFDDSAGASISGAPSGTNYLIQVTGIALENWNWELSVDATIVAH